MIQCFQQSVVSPSYFPPVEYFYVIARSGKVFVEQHELYQKQSYRNRCRIYSAQGVEQLIIPVVKDEIHARPIRDVRIDYSESWMVQHRRAMEAAYNNSPFFLYYKDDFAVIMDKKPKFLFDLDLMLTEKLLELLGLKVQLCLTDEYIKEYPEGDFRTRIQPKYKGVSLMEEQQARQQYFQVFSHKMGFKPNLSVLDLLSAEGPNAISYL